MLMDFGLNARVEMLVAASRDIGPPRALELARDGSRVAVILIFRAELGDPIAHVECHGFAHGALDGASFRVNSSFPVAGHFQLA